MKKLRSVFLILLICAILPLSGCYLLPDVDPGDIFGGDNTYYTGTLPWVSQETLHIQTSASRTEPPRTDPVLTSPSSATDPVFTEETIPEFYELVSLGEYLNDMKKADIMDIRFIYLGIDPLDGPMLARMTNACYVSYYENGRGLYELHLTEYPGDRIVDAWFSGDTSNLNESELYAMNTAVEMVTYAMDTASNRMELEIILHDLIVEQVSYLDNTRDVPDPLNPPRNLTVVGALLDGYANCQGYTDAFYTLASMAGFEVGRMSVYTSNDLHSVNTICLDGNWYIVDVTFDDNDNESSNYRLLNAGIDVIHEYEWHEYNQTCPLVYSSDENYYYNYYYLVYNDIYQMAADIAASYAVNGNTVFRSMLLYQQDDDRLNTILYDELMRYENLAFDYTYWYEFTGRDTIYTVYFH